MKINYYLVLLRATLDQLKDTISALTYCYLRNKIIGKSTIEIFREYMAAWRLHTEIEAKIKQMEQEGE